MQAVVILLGFPCAKAAMQGESSTQLSCVLGVFAGRVGGGGKLVDRAGHAGESDNGEGLGGSAPHAGNGGFEQDQMGVELDRGSGGQVWTGGYGGCPSVLSRPTGAGDDGEVTG